MLITVDKLQELHADTKFINWLLYYFPKGATLSQIFSCPAAEPEMLHWCNFYFATTAEEQELYYKGLNIDCKFPFNIYESDNVRNSNWISRSSNVVDSSHIFYCKDVINSNNVLSSEDVRDSEKVYNSEFVYKSRNVLNSKNITESAFVVNADYVVNSNSVNNATAVMKSAFVTGRKDGATYQIRNSRFICDCSNMKKSLFCYGISNAEYMLFNQQMEPEDYELIVEQFDAKLGKFHNVLVANDEWPANIIPLEAPKIQRRISDVYSQVPLEFWRWVKTLPGYNQNILFNITYNMELFMY